LKSRVIIFADIDGTILDNKYDCSQVQPIILELLSLKASIVLTSSKTKAEIEFYRKKLGINDPFIVENGSAIIIPKKIFAVKYSYTKQNQRYRIIELGTGYSIIRKALAFVEKKNHATIIKFGDMTTEEVANDTGLPLNLAILAKKREYDEAFKITKGNKQKILRDLENEGLSYTKGGRYFHILGNTDKGKAIIVLKALYIKEFYKVATIGIGNSQNDLPMASAVDTLIIISKNNQIAAWQKVLEITKDYAN
jgi:mannosyl-3-phosphoglycerate phosphatase